MINMLKRYFGLPRGREIFTKMIIAAIGMAGIAIALGGLVNTVIAVGIGALYFGVVLSRMT